jgi:hypothetical protein
MEKRNKELSRLKRDIRAYLRWIFRELAVPPHERKPVLASVQVDRCAERLLDDGAYFWEGYPVDFYRLKIPESFVFCVPRDRNALRFDRPPSQRGQCLVGCRFIREVQDRLNSVLEPILAYYGYEIVFQSSLGGRQILKQVFDRLASGEIAFALFDTQRTARRPNVFIELGVAYALGKPFILLEREGSVRPSDLEGLITLRYSTYRDLALQLTLRLPTFLRDERLLQT